MAKYLIKWIYIARFLKIFLGQKYESYNSQDLYASRYELQLCHMLLFLKSVHSQILRPINFK